MTKNNTQAINDQRDNYYYANFRNSVDLDTSSRFTQGFVAAQIFELASKESDYLREMIDAQSKNIGSSIAAGFGTAIASVVEGTAASIGGVGTSGAGVKQAEESVKQAAEISKLQGDTSTAIEKYNEEKNLSVAGQMRKNPPTDTSAQITLNEVGNSESPEARENHTFVVDMTQTQPQATQSPSPTPAPASQTSTPVATSTPRQVTSAEADVLLNGNGPRDMTQVNLAEVSATSPNQAIETPPTSNNAAQTQEQTNPENLEGQKAADEKREPRTGTDSSDPKKNNFEITNSEEKILSKHKTKLAELEQKNQRSGQIGSAIQAGSQAMTQLPAKGSEGYGQANRTGEATFKTAADGAKSAADSMAKAVDALRINPFQANEAVRA